MTKINNFIIGTHSLANKTFSSIYSSEHEDGVIMNADECAVNYTYKFLNSYPSAQLCKNLSEIVGMVDENLLLEPKEIVNGTTNVFGEIYNIANGNESYSTLNLNDVVEFLGLQDCSAASVRESLQQWVIPQTTTAEFDKEENWLTQEIDILSFKVPVWSMLATAAAGIGLVGTGIGYCIGRCTQKQDSSSKNIDLEDMQYGQGFMRNTSVDKLKDQRDEATPLVKHSTVSSSGHVTPGGSSEYSEPLNNVTPYAVTLLNNNSYNQEEGNLLGHTYEEVN